MRDINFGEESDYGWFHAPSYGELVDSMEFNELIDEHDDDYQGDSYYLLSDGDRFGILVFGWGSCSGCDALEGAESKAEVIELRDDLVASIVWRTEAEMIEYLRTSDKPSQWYYYRDAGRRFDDRLMAWFGVEKPSEETEDDGLEDWERELLAD